MLTVLTPAEHSRLTTVQAVRDRLKISDGEAADAIVESMIDTASRMAVEFTNRVFGLERVKQTENFCRPVRAILLDRSPATNISVQYGGEALTADDWVLDVDSNLLMRSATGRLGWWGDVEITYDAGWVLPEGVEPTLPPTVEHAVLRLVGALWSAEDRDPLVKSEDIPAIGRTDYWMPGQTSRLPDPHAEMILQAYRRI